MSARHTLCQIFSGIFTSVDTIHDFISRTSGLLLMSPGDKPMSVIVEIMTIPSHIFDTEIPIGSFVNKLETKIAIS